MRLVIEVDDPEIVVQLRSAGKTVPTTRAMPKADDVDQTEATDAGAAPSAPGLGPLVNITKTSDAKQPEQGKQLPGAGDSSAGVEAKSRQSKASSDEKSGEVPMIDAGAASADILAHTTPMGMGREN